MKVPLTLVAAFLLAALLPAVAQAQFDFTISNGAITITGYTGTGGAVAIPSTINGLPVTSIGSNAFANRTALTSVTIPEGVSSIGGNAFFSCGSLSSVTIPNSVTNIGSNAFYGCSKLTSVTIPSNVTSIGGNAFYGCTSLTAINVAANNLAYRSVAGVLFDFSQTTLIEYPAGNAGTSYTIPSSVTSIWANAFFRCVSLTSVTIPSSVTTIGSNAFYGCSGLISVTISNGVTSIEANTFHSCSSLTSFIIPSSVTSIGSTAFFGCSSLTSVTIPDGVSSIGLSTFAYCDSLISVTIPSSVTSLGSNAFYRCSNLTAINVAANNLAYRSVAGVLFNFTQTTLIEYPAGRVGASYTIPSGVTRIGGSAFAYCISLTNVTIPDSVTSIDSNGFYGCSSLASITIPRSVISINSSAFSNCSSLTAINVDANNIAYSSVTGVLFDLNQTTLIEYPAGKFEPAYTIPNGISSIGAYAFLFCSSLTSITIPSSVTSIGLRAFSNCSSLTSVTIPSSVISLGESVFYGCTNLTAISVDQSNPVYRSIAGVLFTFSQTTLIEYPAGNIAATYTVPSGVTSIGDYSFAFCSSLNSIIFQENAPSVGSSVFYVGLAPALKVTVYYASGTSGWGSTFAGRPTVSMAPPVITTPVAIAAVIAGANATFSVAAIGSPVPTYQWQVSTDGGSTWNNVTGVGYVGTTTDTLTITAATTAVLGYQYQAVISNPAGITSTTPVPLVVGTSNAKLTWLQSNYSPAQLGNPNMVDDLATPAHDGIPNLLKYALGLNALTNGQGSLPQPTLSSGQAIVTFQAPQSDVTCTVQASTDLINWSTAGVTTQTNGTQVTASHSLPGNTPVFLHIVIAPAP